MNGLVLIDKPPGCTSHDVVNRWRRLARTKRVGHLGTLDPMATGLLAIVTGIATRLAPFFGGHEKTYEARIAFGFTSSTYDAEGEVVATGVPAPDESLVMAALNQFRGRFWQKPPAVSAKKIGGVAAYKLVRQNIEVDLKPVEVEITRLDVLSFQDGILNLIVTCAAGTYIRSLAHDLGQQLGCGAILTALRRTQIGELDVSSARTLDQLACLAEQDRLSEAVIPAAALLPQFPSEHYDVIAESHIRQGRDFRTSPFVVKPGAPHVKAISHSGELIAIGELKFPNLYHPGIVFQPEETSSGRASVLHK